MQFLRVRCRRVETPKKASCVVVVVVLCSSFSCGGDLVYYLEYLDKNLDLPQAYPCYDSDHAVVRVICCGAVYIGPGPGSCSCSCSSHDSHHLCVQEIVGRSSVRTCTCCADVYLCFCSCSCSGPLSGKHCLLCFCSCSCSCAFLPWLFRISILQEKERRTR